MKLADLLEEFNVVIDTAEGLTELRSLILGLAVRGKLVLQDPNDEPASELLKKIETEKERLYEEGEIRKPKKLNPVNEREKPFDIPDSWKWCRLGEIYGDIGTTNPESKFSYIDVSSIDNTKYEIDYSKVENISAEDAPSRARREVKEESVIYSTVRPYLNNVAIVKNSFDYKPIASTAFEVITVFEGILNKYVYRYLLSDPFLDYVNFKMVGVAYPAINKGDMQSAIISIPPTAEQHRIVQKIESLFAEVDELEAKLNRQTKLDEKLQLAVNAEVQQAPDAEASQSAWNFITSHFDTLYHTPEAIDNLKKNILNEAVRGRLAPQNPNDEPASKLLKKIEAEKQRLYDEGEIRKPKKLPPVKEDEIPFEIPESWELTRIGNMFEIQRGSSPRPKGDPRYFSDSKTEYNWIKISDITAYTENDFLYATDEYLTKEGTEHSRKVSFNDIIIAASGSVGKAAKLGIEGYIYDGLMAIKFIHDEGLRDYLFMYLTTLVSQFMNDSTGTSWKNINTEILNNTVVPLPPLEEQHRIVQRIEELFAICDRFKAQLEQREKVNERLVKGLVGEVLEKAWSAEKEPVKVEEISMAAEPEVGYQPNKGVRILEFRPRITKPELKSVPSVNKTQLHGALVSRILVLNENHNPKRKHTGRTKIEKTVHIIESHLKHDLGRVPVRDARGAADFTRMRTKVEPMASKKGWFNVKDSDRKAFYSPGTRIEDAYRKSMTYFQKDLAEVDRIIKLFVPLSTRKAEVYQTTYAAWHDLLAMGYEPTHDDIVMHASTKEFWHEEKEKIPKENFYGAIEWLKKNNLVPDGKGKFTKPK